MGVGKVVTLTGVGNVVVRSVGVGLGTVGLGTVGLGTVGLGTVVV